MVSLRIALFGLLATKAWKKRPEVVSLLTLTAHGDLAVVNSTVLFGIKGFSYDLKICIKVVRIHQYHRVPQLYINQHGTFPVPRSQSE